MGSYRPTKDSRPAFGGLVVFGEELVQCCLSLFRGCDVLFPFLQQLAAMALARRAVAQYPLAERNDADFLASRGGLGREVITVPARRAKTLAFEVGFE
jgi:hypothetical protein